MIGSNSIPEGCEFAEFDAEIFCAPVWRINQSSVFSESRLAQIIESALAQDVALISCRVDVMATTCQRRLIQAGFRKIETLVTLEREIRRQPESECIVHVAKNTEYSLILNLAAGAFVFDRFGKDPMISDDIANNFKLNWMKNNIYGRADAILTANHMGNFAGFVACLRFNNLVVIDLIAVVPEARGQGIGEQLIKQTLTHFAGIADVLRVGTQFINLPALKLYKKLGFSQIGARETFHWTPGRL